MTQLFNQSQVFYTVALSIFGLFMGSFLNVVAWRLPQGRGFGGRSACPQCGHQLNSRDLVPLLSYAVTGGRCRYCKHPISARYPLVELITGGLFGLVSFAVLRPFATTGNVDLNQALVVWTLLRAMVIASVAVVIFLVDFDHYLILDIVTFPAAAMFVVWNFLTALQTGMWVAHFGTPLFAALVLAIPFALLFYLSRGRLMGFGGVKYIFLIGLMLSLQAGVVALAVAFALGTLFGLVAIVAKRKTLMSKIPFGTFLSIGVVAALVWTPVVVRWYLDLIGWQ